MYQVADNMQRLQYISEMKVASYTDEDIEYMQALIRCDQEFISDGAAFTLFISCKDTIIKIAAEYQTIVTETLHQEVPKKVRLLFYASARRILPQLLLNYYYHSDFDEYMTEKLKLLYSQIIKQEMDFSV